MDLGGVRHIKLEAVVVVVVEAVGHRALFFEIYGGDLGYVDWKFGVDVEVDVEVVVYDDCLFGLFLLVSAVVQVVHLRFGLMPLLLLLCTALI